MKLFLALIASTFLGACGSPESTSAVQSILDLSSHTVCADLQGASQSDEGFLLTDNWGQTIAVHLTTEASETWTAVRKKIDKTSLSPVHLCVTGPQAVALLDGKLVFTGTAVQISDSSPISTGGVSVGNQVEAPVENEL